MNSWRLIFSSAVAIAGLILFAGAPETSAKEGKKNQPETDALFTNGTVLHLRIRIAATNVAALRQQPHKYVHATVREGAVVYSNVLVHLKGSAGSFRQIDDKPGLTLKFDPDQGGSLFHGMKKFHLNNSVQDPSYVSELITQEMFDQAGVPATRVAHALVELNGRRLGLFVLVESVGKQFLSRYFENPAGNVYGQPGNADITDSIARMSGHDGNNRAELKALAAATQEQDLPRRMQRLQETLDLDRFLSFMAMEVMLDHWDGYTASRHNYRVYHDVSTGRVVFIPHDLDQVIRNANAPIVPPGNGIVSQAILRTPELRRSYVARCGTLFTNVFVPSRLTKRVDEVLARIGPAVKAYDENLARDIENHANGFKHRLNNRAQFLARQLNVAPSDRLTYQNNIATLNGWRPGVNAANARQNQVKDATGKSTLWISATGQTKVSWRKRIKLEPGHYRFEGMARTAGVVAAGVARKGEGAGLRISGTKQPRDNKLSGDSSWEKLSYEFDAPPELEVELVCELCATKGEVWFDTDSLKLVRVR